MPDVQSSNSQLCISFLMNFTFVLGLTNINEFHFVQTFVVRGRGRVQMYHFPCLLIRPRLFVLFQLQNISQCCLVFSISPVFSPSFSAYLSLLHFVGHLSFGYNLRSLRVNLCFRR